jgi:hypothetical protein
MTTEEHRRRKRSVVQHLITLDYVLRKGAQSNTGQESRPGFACCAMRFAPHTALPRAKGMHQPRDSAVLSSKQTATATSNREWAQTVKGGGGGAAVRNLIRSHSAPPPVCAPPLSGAKKRGRQMAQRIRGTSAGRGSLDPSHTLLPPSSLASAKRNNRNKRNKRNVAPLMTTVTQDNDAHDNSENGGVEYNTCV